ncbi:14 kDa phosphohistidine phosphatase-like [Trichogramma pretiosum]|uniref:14 kDa phosphohistidine phosphatase-like n=1 Tax=Trichogramma pretiosum TaxID=7493 RepID=UPI0006C982AA|nr:14 kDa phosphohistidine phosphatase-like [Trichogramma pretiosum]
MITLLNICRLNFRRVVSNYSTCLKMSEVLKTVEDVDIDPCGVYKYILIEVQEKKTKEKKNIVRGYARCEYHADILDEVEIALKKISTNLKAKCVGGGRIQHDAETKKIKVYGYSQGFGKADHEISTNLLKKKYSDYTITWSDEGY